MAGERVEAPNCPTWCTVNHAGWDVDRFETSKTCTRTIPAAVDVDGHPVTVELARYASLDGADVTVDRPVVAVRCGGNLTHTAALDVAEALIRAAGLISSSLSREAAA